MSLQTGKGSRVQLCIALGVFAVLPALVAGAASPALAQKGGTRQSMMETVCAATGVTRCVEKATEAATRGEPFPLVMLKGCQADLSAAGPGGPAAIDAAKTGAVACLAEAVRQGKQLPASELLVGQSNLRKKPAYKGQTDTQVVDSFRAALSQTDSKCSRIANMYTRYNCYAGRVADLAPPSR